MTEEIEKPAEGDIVVAVTSHLKDGESYKEGRLIELAVRSMQISLEYLGAWPSELSIVFVGDTEMAALNEQYRGKVGTTDVLSFPMIGDEEENEPAGMDYLLGDILISAPQAERQALEDERPYMREVATLLIHGLFHLLGYDHEISEEEADEMERLEAGCLSHLESEAPELLL